MGPVANADKFKFSNLQSRMCQAGCGAEMKIQNFNELFNEEQFSAFAETLFFFFGFFF